MKYKGQQNEDLAYGGWIRAITQPETVKPNRSREKVNREQFQSKANALATTSLRSCKFQSNLVGQNGSYLNKSGPKLDDGVEPVGTSNELRTEKKHLMLIVIEPENQQVKGQSMGCDINEVWDRVASNDNHSSYECMNPGKKRLEGK